MTPSQGKTLRALSALIDERGYAPTVRELAARLGWRSPHSAHAHLRALRDQGLVTWWEGHSRTLCLTEDAVGVMAPEAECDAALD